MESIQKTVIYPHGILLFKQIAVFLLFFTVPATAAAWFLCPKQYLSWAVLIVSLGTTSFIFYSGLYYTHTKTTLEDQGLVVQKGWIPQKQDSIFWIHVKDVNAQASAVESLFGCGTIILKVTIRSHEETVLLPFIPNHQAVFEVIRKKLGQLNKDARPMTYS